MNYKMRANFGLMCLVASVFLIESVTCADNTDSSTQPTVAYAQGATNHQLSVGPFLNLIPVCMRPLEGEQRLTLYRIYSSFRPKMKVMMDSDFTTSFDFSIICINRNISVVLNVSVYDTDTMKVRGQSLFPITCKHAVEKRLDVYSTPLPMSQNSTIPYRTVYVALGEINVDLRSGIIGHGIIEFSLLSVSGHGNETCPKPAQRDQESNTVTFVTMEPTKSRNTLTYTFSIIRKIRPVDRIFRLILYSVQIFVGTGFGCKLDMAAVKANLLHPVAPGIGIICQYLFMPLIAFAVAKTVRIDIAAVSLGIFVAGCCPGGGASNMYSYLLKGDLSLSITMTALSTFLALAMLPFWIYTLGSQFSMDEELTIPFQMVVMSLSILIIPLIVGLFLRHKYPKVADTIQMLLKPIILIMILLLISLGIYSNLYIFRLFRPSVILAACLLPYIGYISGGLVAVIFRQPWKRIKTISLETGMQNTSIAYILLINSLDAPNGDIAVTGSIASAMMTPIPPFTVTIFYLIYQKLRNHKADDDDVGNVDTNGKDDVARSEDGADETLTTEMMQTDTIDEKCTNEKVALAAV